MTAVLAACDRGPRADDSARNSDTALPAPLDPPDEPSPRFASVDAPTRYVGDAACVSCHAREAATYRQHAMSQSFHRWTAATRIETTLDTPLQNRPTGFSYAVIEQEGRLYQVERLTSPDGRRLHELRKRIDYVMGSGAVARTYFTEENGRLFQLPLTWYRTTGWDFSPGYEVNNARFDRLMPDRCIGCHSSYPRTLPALEGKFAEVRPGIGCERCHGPGALHVGSRRAAGRHDGAYDRTIVNPARLPLERRMDVCEQCHVHTAVTVLREGKTDFSYVPSQPLRDQYAFFKVAGTIDIVSHADRLRQSRCFLATRTTATPLECATCHNPHATPAPGAINATCQRCHAPVALQQHFAQSPARSVHIATANCVSCHMPRVQERAVPHGGFTDHWIRVVRAGSAQPTMHQSSSESIEPFYARDRTGSEADVYRGMGGVVYATLANDGRALSNAAAALDAALTGDTTRGDAHFLLGAAFQQLGRTGDAIRALEQSVHIDASHPERLRALAQSYERGGRPADTIETLYRRALTIQPALAWIRADHADFLRAHDRGSEARQEYRRALSEQPGLATAWFNLGTLLLEEGDTRGATEPFRKAVALDPSIAAALSALIAVRTRDSAVVAVTPMQTPLASLPVRERGPQAVRMTVGGTGAPGVSFENLPPRGVVQILKPDGTPVRTLPTAGNLTVHWNLSTDSGQPVAGGLYRVQVQGRDATGRASPPKPLFIGIVRERGE
jgi:Tfp pilus assembly protein PilF